MLFVVAMYDEHRVLTSTTTTFNFMDFASSVLWDTGLRLRLCHEKINAFNYSSSLEIVSLDFITPPSRSSHHGFCHDIASCQNSPVIF